MNVKQACTFLTEMAQAYPFHAEDINEVIARLRAPAALPEGYWLVPVQPTEAMLRPFHDCPPDELSLAWAAALHIAAKLAPAPSGVSAPAAVVPELRQIVEIDHSSDMAVSLRFTSCRAASSFFRQVKDARWPDAAAPAPNAQPSELPPLPPITLAVIGRRHFGNPIPKEWYAAAGDLLSDVSKYDYARAALAHAQSDSAGDARDAARYRWLRDHCGMRYKPANGRAYRTAEESDDAIDAAIAASAATKGEQR